MTELETILVEHGAPFNALVSACAAIKDGARLVRATRRLSRWFPTQTLYLILPVKYDRRALVASGWKNCPYPALRRVAWSKP